MLNLGEVRYACEVTLNGVPLGSRIWPSYEFTVKNILREGANELRIVVTNTLANQFVTTKVFERWPENVLGPYHRIAQMFESESMSSGLFGPVGLYA